MRAPRFSLGEKIISGSPARNSADRSPLRVLRSRRARSFTSASRAEDYESPRDYYASFLRIASPLLESCRKRDILHKGPGICIRALEIRLASSHELAPSRS